MQGTTPRRPPPSLPLTSNARGLVEQPQQQPPKSDESDEWEDMHPTPQRLLRMRRAEEAMRAAQGVRMDAPPTNAAAYQRPAGAQEFAQELAQELAQPREKQQRPAAQLAPLAVRSRSGRGVSQSTDSNAVLCSSYTLIKAVGFMLKSKIAVLAFQVVCFAGLLAMFLLYADVRPDSDAVRNKLWLWWFQFSCYATATTILAALVPSIRRALLVSEEGYLNKLGLGTERISVADKKYLDRCEFRILARSVELLLNAPAHPFGGHSQATLGPNLRSILGRG
jgi:hypothetical protein